MQGATSFIRHALVSLMLISVCQGTGRAQVTFLITQLPSSTPPGSQIYLSGNFEGWTGGQEAYRLQKDADSLYFITLPQMVGTIQFKFTRGSWASVEKGPNGEEIANRTYTFGGNGAVVNVTIHNWADLSGITSTAADNVYLIDDAFYIPQLNRTRKIWVYLPPEYDSSDNHYPVLYMHDGQNIFDDSTSFAGEWRVDESLNELYDETHFGLIVVGIENDGAHRIDEYSPWINPQYGGGEGEAYIDFIIETLKPHIDSTYRTTPDPEYTGIMGSSMGGLISHYGGIANPDVFGRVGIFSPSFGLFDSCYAFTAEEGVSSGSKIYLLAGGQEGNVALWATQMRDLLLAEGASAEDVRLEIDPLGMHNEEFWSGTFDDAVIWLFTSMNVGMEGVRAPSLPLVSIFPNPASQFLHIQPVDISESMNITVFDLQGTQLYQVAFSGNHELDLSLFPAGVYYFRVTSSNGSFVSKIVLK